MDLTHSSPSTIEGFVKAGLFKGVLKTAFAAAVAMMGVLDAGQAQAIVVNVNGQEWEVTTFVGSYNDNIDKFATEAHGGVMPWWNNSSLAEAFASAVGLNLGLPPENTVGFENAGPLFGFGSVVFEQEGVRTERVVDVARIKELIAEDQIDEDQNRLVFNGKSTVLETGVSIVPAFVWAQATPATHEVPGPLPALGAGAAFGFSRKLRKRIKASTNPVCSTYSL